MYSILSLGIPFSACWFPAMCDVELGERPTKFFGDQKEIFFEIFDF